MSVIENSKKPVMDSYSFYFGKMYIYIYSEWKPLPKMKVWTSGINLSISNVNIQKPIANSRIIGKIPSQTQIYVMTVNYKPGCATCPSQRMSFENFTYDFFLLFQISIFIALYSKSGNCYSGPTPYICPPTRGTILFNLLNKMENKIEYWVYTFIQNKIFKFSLFQSDIALPYNKIFSNFPIFYFSQTVPRMWIS